MKIGSRRLECLQSNIYVTNRCDRQCAHCYYPHDDMTMSLDVARDIGRWIVKTCKDYDVKLYKAHFLGGEPFNAIDRVRWLVDYLYTFLPTTTHGLEDGN